MNYKRLFVKNGCIFITMVTNNRIPILINNIENIAQSYLDVSRIYPFELIAYSVQNDHLHCIIRPKEIREYPKIVKSFKYSVTKKVGLVNPTYSRIWQNRYWEHTLRDEEDLNRHIDYVHYNPVKHNLVKNVKDWKYSSFHKFVEQNLYDINWGTSEDIQKIIDLDFE